MLIEFIKIIFGRQGESAKQEERIAKPQGFYKSWILFAIFSLAASYTHYYGLATAGIINLVLFIYFITKHIQAHKKKKKDTINSLNFKFRSFF